MKKILIIFLSILSGFTLLYLTYSKFMPQPLTLNDDKIITFAMPHTGNRSPKAHINIFNEDLILEESAILNEMGNFSYNPKTETLVHFDTSGLSYQFEGEELEILDIGSKGAYITQIILTEQYRIALIAGSPSDDVGGIPQSFIVNLDTKESLRTSGLLFYRGIILHDKLYLRNSVKSTVYIEVVDLKEMTSSKIEPGFSAFLFFQRGQTLMLADGDTGNVYKLIDKTLVKEDFLFEGLDAYTFITDEIFNNLSLNDEDITLIVSGEIYDYSNENGASIHTLYENDTMTVIPIIFPDGQVPSYIRSTNILDNGDIIIVYAAFEEGKPGDFIARVNLQGKIETYTRIPHPDDTIEQGLSYKSFVR